MKKAIVSAMRKTVEKVAAVPVNLRSWPATMNQPKMPNILREKMKDCDNR